MDGPSELGEAGGHFAENNLCVPDAVYQDDGISIERTVHFAGKLLADYSINHSPREFYHY